MTNQLFILFSLLLLTCNSGFCQSIETIQLITQEFSKNKKIIEELKRENQELNSKISRLESKERANIKKITKVHKELNEVNSLLQSKTVELQKLLIEAQSLRAENASLRLLVKDLNSEIESLKNFISQNNVLTFVPAGNAVKSDSTKNDLVGSGLVSEKINNYKAPIVNEDSKFIQGGKIDNLEPYPYYYNTEPGNTVAPQKNSLPCEQHNTGTVCIENYSGKKVKVSLGGQNEFELHNRSKQCFEVHVGAFTYVVYYATILDALGNQQYEKQGYSHQVSVRQCQTLSHALTLIAGNQNFKESLNNSVILPASPIQPTKPSGRVCFINNDYYQRNVVVTITSLGNDKINDIYLKAHGGRACIDNLPYGTYHYKVKTDRNIMQSIIKEDNFTISQNEIVINIRH